MVSADELIYARYLVGRVVCVVDLISVMLCFLAMQFWNTKQRSRCWTKPTSYVDTMKCET